MSSAQICIEQEVAAAAVEQPVLLYYAFACKYTGKWFLCRGKKPRYKQLILLFELGCVLTDKPLFIPENQPVVGGVYWTTDEKTVECVSVDWV